MAEKIRPALSFWQFAVAEILEMVARTERECAEALQKDEQGRFRELLRKSFRVENRDFAGESEL